jgi:hypothetical protein
MMLSDFLNVSETGAKHIFDIHLLEQFHLYFLDVLLNYNRKDEIINNDILAVDSLP